MNIYEQEQLAHFEKQLLSGVYSEQTLIQLYESGQLSEGQQKLIQELAPMLGGMANVAKKIGSNIGSAYKQARTQGLDKASKDWAGRAKNAYAQGKQDTQYGNHVNSAGKKWQMIDNTITKSRLFEQLEAFRKVFNGQDQYIDQALGYINTTFLDLQHYLSLKYPQLNVQTDQSYTPEWKKVEDQKRAQQQKSIDAQTGVAGTQQRQRYRQDVAQNPGKPRNTLGNKIRGAMQ